MCRLGGNKGAQNVWLRLVASYAIHSHHQNATTVYKIDKSFIRLVD